jgi:hypothetical protein
LTADRRRHMLTVSGGGANNGERPDRGGTLRTELERFERRERATLKRAREAHGLLVGTLARRGRGERFNRAHRAYIAAAMAHYRAVRDTDAAAGRAVVKGRAWSFAVALATSAASAAAPALAFILSIGG